MVIRKFIATTEEEATKLAKEELGEDVVIMNVKQVSAKGIMKFFRKPSVELTAAIDDIRPAEEKENDLPDFSKLQEAIKETNAVLEAEEKRKAEAEKEKKEDKKQEEKKESNVSKHVKNNILPDDNEKEIKSEKQDMALEERLSNLQDLLEKQMQVSKEEKLNAKLILQVHDELIVEAPLPEAEKAKQIVTSEMEKAMQLCVPLKIDCNVGKTWYDTK